MQLNSFIVYVGVVVLKTIYLVTTIGKGEIKEKDARN
jgi:hypothetical protein